MGSLPCPSAHPLVGFPTPSSLVLNYTSLPPLPQRYGGFSLGSPDVGLPSGHAVGRSQEELRVLLGPEPGGALDHVLDNLMAWACGLDAQHSVKVGPGGSGQVAGGSRADFTTLTPRP